MATIISRARTTSSARLCAQGTSINGLRCASSVYTEPLLEPLRERKAISASAWKLGNAFPATSPAKMTSRFSPHFFPCALAKATSSTSRLNQLNRHFSSSTNAMSSSSSNNNNNEFKLENLFSVKGRIAVVTGGGTGIGLMITQALAVNGAKVYIIGRTKEKLDTVVKTYGQDIPGEIIPLQGDVSKKEDIQRIYEEIKSKEKCVSILVNNAGISGATFEVEAKTAEEMSKNLFHDKESTFEDWVDTYRTNVPQLYFMTTAFLPLLQAASELEHGYSAAVINISSISGIVKTAQHHFAYNASKAAAIHLTRMLASEIAQNRLKIRVNSIAPGVFPSEMTADDSDAKQKSHIPKDKYEDKVPARRPGKDSDMGSAALFIATNQYLNGAIIPVDGGYIIEAGSASY